MSSLKRKIIMTIIAGLLLSGSSLTAQLRSDAAYLTELEQLRSLASPTLMDSQRFSMNHSFSLSFMSGGAFGSGSMAVYTNSMRYMLSPNLAFSTQIHLAQPSLNNLNQLGQDNLQAFFNTSLDWRPTDFLQLHLGISNIPRYQRYGQGYYPSPWMNTRSARRSTGLE